MHRASYRVLTLKYKLDLDTSCTYMCILTFSRLLYITSHQNILSFHNTKKQVLRCACYMFNLVCRKNISIQKRYIVKYINIHLYLEYKPLHFTPFFNIFKGLLLIHESFESPPIYNKSPITRRYHHFQFYTSHHNIL